MMTDDFLRGGRSYAVELIDECIADAFERGQVVGREEVSVPQYQRGWEEGYAMGIKHAHQDMRGKVVIQIACAAVICFVVWLVF